MWDPACHRSSYSRRCTPVFAFQPLPWVGQSLPGARRASAAGSLNNVLPRARKTPPGSKQPAALTDPPLGLHLILFGIRRGTGGIFSPTRNLSFVTQKSKRTAFLARLAVNDSLVTSSTVCAGSNVDRPLVCSWRGSDFRRLGLFGSGFAGFRTKAKAIVVKALERLFARYRPTAAGEFGHDHLTLPVQRPHG